ncbi:hypothetical protein O9G_001397 [Rozella allomycis CSF55]|uniref:Uncharacterized protein n=1 Tax=Rozella allomycis (strain CSF55) TaxID=988480 RepID=A0A075B3I9_ROZAC|nr:hypothetical protein O9G_001397 [Rozella allomycis CSF55]|eukprot:EPZ36952.1 hypothetical protein O9G_001397 [Rozella allomycis CSF55]
MIADTHADNEAINEQIKEIDDKNLPVEEWLLLRVGSIPRNSVGWFRCGVAFYNKKEFLRAIDCLQKSVELDPLNYNAYQIIARACIALNRKQEAIAALKQSVNLDNPSDWQLLVELTAATEGAE